jgi:uncharacterized protein with GYD domain
MIAYVLITAEVGTLRTVQERLNGVSGITKAAVVAGVYDLIAIVEADGQEQLSRVVLDVIQTTPGVVRTVTLIELV